MSHCRKDKIDALRAELVYWKSRKEETAVEYKKVLERLKKYKNGV